MIPADLKFQTLFLSPCHHSMACPHIMDGGDSLQEVVFQLGALAGG
jgi:hypothetical protein